MDGTGINTCAYRLAYRGTYTYGKHGTKERVRVAASSIVGIVSRLKNAMFYFSVDDGGTQLLKQF